MQDHSYKRHIAKAITWRIVGTIDTIILSWIITGNPMLGMQIGAVEFFSKILLYYAHERVWFKVNLNKHGKLRESRKRHLAKTISWRIVGSVSTMLLAWVITGNSFSGIKIGLAEVVTKMLLYYFHERTWYKIGFGLDERRRRKKADGAKDTINTSKGIPILINTQLTEQ
ncbi:MAG: DUF2061 domain-containing protein [Ginsengibacter sp.]